MSKVVLIGGGSASGKTFVLNKVLEKIPENKVAHISLDDYYKDFSVLPFEERTKVNFDHPKSFDWKLMCEQIESLKKGNKIEKPIYDFVTHSRKKETEIVEPKELIIIEGIMALVNKELRSIGDLMVFISASRERRLVRRIERDTKERGRTYESVIEQYFSTVLPMYEEIIAPSQYYADLIINNDGYSKKSIDVLVSVLNNMMEKDNEK
ncbi:MAG: uridine kinase [Bacilli bacterium]|nr:uridine kinase [Bacilli bacterium]